MRPRRAGKLAPWLAPATPRWRPSSHEDQLFHARHPGLSPREGIALAARLGFDGVDFRLHEEDGDVKLATPPAQIAELRQTLVGAGVEVGHVLSLSYARPENMDSASQREAVREPWRREAALCHALGAGFLRIFLNVPAREADAREHVRRVGEVLGEVAEQMPPGLWLVHQNHRAASFDLTETAPLFARCAHPRVGLFFSPEHSLHLGEPWREQLPPLAARTPAVYLAETDESRVPAPGTRLEPELDATLYREILAHCTPHWLACKWEKIYHPEKLAGPQTALPRFLAAARSLSRATVST